MANLGLTEIITNKHGGQEPRTKRSKNKGQPFHDGPKSYHMLLCINISHKIALGEKIPI